MALEMFHETSVGEIALTVDKNALAKIGRAALVCWGKNTPFRGVFPTQRQRALGEMKSVELIQRSPVKHLLCCEGRP